MKSISQTIKYQLRTLVCIIVTAALVSCKSNKTLTGIYSPNTNNSPDSFTLTIMNDGKFLFKSFSHVLGPETIKGTWKVENKVLFLNEDTSRVNKNYIEVVEKIQNEKSKIIVHAIDAKDRSPIVGAYIRINEAFERYVIATSGVVSVPYTGSLNSIVFTYGTISQRIKINNPNSNDINLLIHFENMPAIYKITVPQTWLIKKNKLIPLNNSGTVESMNHVYIRK